VLPSSTKTDFNGVPAKAEPSTNSTFRGIKIDSKFESENAHDSIRFNDDGDSNEMDESNLQSERQHDPRILTKFGITRSFPMSNPRINLKRKISIRK
jgi:hypothetical protein